MSVFSFAKKQTTMKIGVRSLLLMGLMASHAVAQATNKMNFFEMCDALSRLVHQNRSDHFKKLRKPKPPVGCRKWCSCCDGSCCDNNGKAHKTKTHKEILSEQWLEPFSDCNLNGFKDGAFCYPNVVCTGVDSDGETVYSNTNDLFLILGVCPDENSP